MKSHILFTAECQVKSIDERMKKPKSPDDNPEPYWTVKDHQDVTYLVYRQHKASAIDVLTRLLPDNPDRMTPPVRLEGYVSLAAGSKYLCLLRVYVWNSVTSLYELPENPGITIQDPENALDVYANEQDTLQTNVDVWYDENRVLYDENR